MAEESIFSHPADEISCIIGNRFTAIAPPCGRKRSIDLVICGMTDAQNYGTLTVKSECCISIGDPVEIHRKLNGNRTVREKRRLRQYRNIYKYKHRHQNEETERSGSFSYAQRPTKALPWADS